MVPGTACAATAAKVFVGNAPESEEYVTEPSRSSTFTPPSKPRTRSFPNVASNSPRSRWRRQGPTGLFRRPFIAIAGLAARIRNIEGVTSVLKPVPGADSPVDGAVAGNAQPEGRGRAVSPAFRVRSIVLTGLNLLALCLVALLYLVVASLLAVLIVRVGADLLDGIDPFLSEARRPRLFPRQIAMRELAVDIARQVLLALLVLGTVRWRDGPAWRRTLGLARSTGAGLPALRLLLILLAWPVVHILWVSGTATVFRAPFAHDVVLSPSLTTAALAAWLLYVVLLAPTAEELLMRGETFSRARAFLGPAGAILLTALLFSLAHLSAAGLARPVSLLPLALMLGWLRWRTGRLWPCIALHGWSNLALVTYVLWP